jgi:anti-sigma B factor antagonist
MRIETRTAENITVVKIHGKLTIDQGAAELRAGLRQLVREGQDRILLNLGGVGYMDSVGIDSLVASYTTVAKSGGQLKFCCLTDRTRQLLDITKLLGVFDTFEGERQALASFSANSVLQK